MGRLGVVLGVARGLRHPVGRVVVGLVAGGLATLTALPADQQYFAGLGRELLEGHLNAVYADPDNQAGPLQLILSAAASVGGVGGAIPLVTVFVLTSLVVTGVGVFLSRMQGLHGMRDLAVSALIVLWCANGAVWGGHPMELVIPTAWTCSALCARRGRVLCAGALLAVAGAVAPWGVLGAPVLLLGGARNAARSTLVAAAAVASSYAPFVMSDRFEQLHYDWAVAQDTFVHLVAPDLQNFGWVGRVIQGAVIVVGGGFAARYFGRNAVVFAPLAVAVLRVATDPLCLGYYWVPVGALAIAALFTGDRRGAPGVWLVLLAYLPWLAFCLPAHRVWMTLPILGVLVVIGVRHRRATGTAAGAESAQRTAPPVRAGVELAAM